MYAAWIARAYPRVKYASLSLELLFNALVAQVHCLAGQVFDLRPHRRVFHRDPLRGQKAVMRVERRVQQVLVVELAEGRGQQNVIHRHRVLRMRIQNLLEARHRAVIVQVVKVLERVTNGRVKIQGVSVQSVLRARYRPGKQHCKHCQKNPPHSKPLPQTHLRFHRAFQ